MLKNEKICIYKKTKGCEIFRANRIEYIAI